MLKKKRGFVQSFQTVGGTHILVSQLCWLQVCHAIGKLFNSGKISPENRVFLSNLCYLIFKGITLKGSEEFLMLQFKYPS